MLAIFRIIKASPGWKFRICEGQTRESEHANTINCIDTKIYNMLNWPHSQAKLIRKNKMYDSFEWANASVEQTKSQKDYER